MKKLLGNVSCTSVRKSVCLFMLERERQREKKKRETEMERERERETKPPSIVVIL